MGGAAMAPERYTTPSDCAANRPPAKTKRQQKSI